MPGLGFHYGFAKLLNGGASLTSPAIVGSLVPDILKYLTGNRYAPHFSETCGCVFPTFGELRHTARIQVFGDDHIATQMPVSNIPRFLSVNRRLFDDSPEYALQTLGHLVADYEYNALMLDTFDFSQDSQNLITVKATGKPLTIAEYRQAAAVDMYAQIDQLLFDLAHVTQDELQKAMEAIQPFLPPAQVEQTRAYLCGNFGTPWHDTGYFTKTQILQFIDKSITATCSFAAKIPA